MLSLCFHVILLALFFEIIWYILYQLSYETNWWKKLLFSTIYLKETQGFLCYTHVHAYMCRSSLHKLNNAHDEFVSLIVPEHLLQQERKIKIFYFQEWKIKFFSKENSQYFNSAYLGEIWDLTMVPLIYI